MVSKDKNLDVVGFLEPFYHRQWWVENRELCGNLEEVVTFHQLHQIFKGLIKYILLAQKRDKIISRSYTKAVLQKEKGWQLPPNLFWAAWQRQLPWPLFRELRQRGPGTRGKLQTATSWEILFHYNLKIWKWDKWCSIAILIYCLKKSAECTAVRNREEMKFWRVPWK